MPADFTKCQNNGGKMRTISGPSKEHGMSAEQYRHICVDRNGAVHLGEIKTKEVKKK